MANPYNLAQMVGEVQEVRPRVARDQVVRDINSAIRLALGQRTFWSDLLRRGVIAIPNTFRTGSVNVTQGSNIVQGSGTGWPVSDVVNTTLANPAKAYGGDYVEVTPSQMNGIKEGSMVYFQGTFDEASAVVEVSRSTFWCKLTNSHDSGTVLTSSSLAGIQFRLASGTPIFTVRAVHSATELEIENPWGGLSRSAASYNIYQAYFGISSAFKDFISIKDETQGIPIKFHVPIDYLDQVDPQRTSSGEPFLVIDHSPSEAGIMQYELWPHQLSASQLSILWFEGWPDLKRDNDRPPWFIDPSVFIAAAKAKALLMKKPVMVGGKLIDPYYDPRAAEAYAAEGYAALQAAINADESKALRALDANWSAMWPGSGSRWSQAHDLDSVLGNY